MDFNRDKPVKISFTVPDKLTVRQQMAYFSESTGMDSKGHLERLWTGARAVIENWSCDLFELDADIDTITNPDITETMLWAAAQVRNHVNKLDEVSKN